jgi:peroxiredoxin Q/BCP
VASTEQRGTGRVRVGEMAPDFTLPSATGEMVSLHDFRGTSTVVLYFYPKDMTAGCTAEACAFRDSYEVFKEAGAVVIGVSADSPESHREFIKRHHLTFTLLSDVDNAVRKRYGATGSWIFGTMHGRVTYVIDRDGIVRQAFSSQINMTKHVSEALRVLSEIQKGQETSVVG